MSAIILQDELVHYEVLGHGRPLVFLHGWVGSWRYWAATMQSVSGTYRTYALDLWGFGTTSRQPANYSLVRQASLVEAFLEEMGIGKIALVGHGLGALVSLILAARIPRQVDRVMVVGLPGEYTALSPRLYTSQPQDLAEWLLARSLDGNAVRLETPKVDPNAIRRSLEDLQAYNLPVLLETMTSPCLMVWGQNDLAVQAIPRERISGFPERIHGMTFEESGHFPMLDEPSKFQHLLIDFLTLDPGASLRQLQFREEWKRRVR
ncbi:MAG TPA: alpha/beta hydrolase [Anaerolineales bacterium]|nr:alpha/beta hydrolase [Anaerolineales bacterium]